MDDELLLLSGDYIPYQDESAENGGFVTEIVVAALNSQGIDVQIKWLPWNRINKALNKGDGVSYNYIKNSEREKVFLFSDPIVDGGDILVARKDRLFQWKTLDDLKDRTLGITQGYSYGDVFDEARTTLNIEEERSDLINLRKVLAGRIDAAVGDRFLVQTLINENFDASQQAQFALIQDPMVIRWMGHLVCSRSNPACAEIVRVFNQGLATIEDNGERHRILQNAGFASH